MQNKINCWEHKKCGREPGGENGEEGDTVEYEKVKE